MVAFVYSCTFSPVKRKLRSEVSRKVGFDCKVILPATHDTASAVMAVPTQKDDTLYISSGTWSLMGVELDKPNTSDGAFNHNFTNEGGVNKTIRFLKNIMGLWLIQESSSSKLRSSPSLSH